VAGCDCDLSAVHQPQLARWRGCARLDAFASAYNTAAAGELRVLYDRRQIQTGDDWRRRIALMLHLCHGGVVLLNEAALESPWVLAEATFLSLRHKYDESFGCFPVAFLDKAELERGFDVRECLQDPEDGRMASWRVANLPDIQFAQGKDAETLAQDIVDSLRDSGQLGKGRSATDQLGAQLAHHLSSGAASILRDIADQLAPS